MGVQEVVHLVCCCSPPFRVLQVVVGGAPAAEVTAEGVRDLSAQRPAAAALLAPTPVTTPTHGWGRGHGRVLHRTLSPHRNVAIFNTHTHTRKLIYHC